MFELIKKIICRIIPYSVRRWLFHPLIVSKDYAGEFSEAESIHLMHHENHGFDDEYWSAVLRKYAHIIDKGLQRCDCEPGHSGDFYNEALTSLSMIKSEKMLRDPSVVWAKNIITSYEKLRFENESPLSSEPFLKTTCHYSDLVDVIKTRRSIRNFTSERIEHDLIKKIAEVANWAPSSCNRQTIKIFIADSDELIKACVEANNGATCFSGKISCFMAFCADLRAYNMPQELTLPVLDVALGIQNSCLVAHSEGVGMALLNWTHHSKEQDTKLRDMLSIPSYYRIVANAVLGYPERGASLPSRKDVNYTYVFR